MNDMCEWHKPDVKPKQPDTEYILCDSIYVSTETGKTNLHRYKSDSGYPLGTDCDCEKAGEQQGSLSDLGARYMGLLI